MGSPAATRVADVVVAVSAVVNITCCGMQNVEAADGAWAFSKERKAADSPGNVNKTKHRKDLSSG